MSPWWLVLIIPISVLAGVVLAAMLAAGKEADRISEAMASRPPEPVTVKVTRYIPQDLWMEKILENTYRNINIGLVNEMAILCEKMGINVWEVIEAAKTKPFGFQAFYPGPGLGGHCIPLDPYYLSWKAREFGFHTSMIEASMMINDRMPEYTVERSGKILNRHRKPLNGSKVLVLGVAYKQDIDDYRESPAIRVIEEFHKTGANVDFYDPFVEKYREKGVWYEGLKAIDTEILHQYDLVCIATGHTTVDYDMVCNAGVPVFDCKNVMKKIANRANIEVL